MTTPTLPPTPSTIANLPLANTPLSGNEFVPISQNGVTKAVAANGFSVVGPTGPAGPTGPPGPTGPAGGAANIATGVINQLAYYSSTTSLSGTNAIPNGTTATTQSAGDNSTKVATTAYVNAASAFSGLTSGTNTAAAMVVGTGASLAASGSGTITATTNANLTGDVTSVGNASTVAKIAGVAVGTPTGTGNVVFSNSPTLVTPALGTPASGNLSNCTGIPSPITVGSTVTPTAAATTTSVSGLPTGIKKVIVNFNNLAFHSFNNTPMIMQIGPVGGIVTSGYNGTSVVGIGSSPTLAALSSSMPLLPSSNSTTANLMGSMQLNLSDSVNNVWAWSYMLAGTGGSGGPSGQQPVWCSGYISLGSGNPLSIITLTAATYGFAATGSWNVNYE